MSHKEFVLCHLYRVGKTMLLMFLINPLIAIKESLFARLDKLEAETSTSHTNVRHSSETISHDYEDVRQFKESHHNAPDNFFFSDRGF